MSESTPPMPQPIDDPIEAVHAVADPRAAALRLYEISLRLLYDAEHMHAEIELMIDDLLDRLYSDRSGGGG